MRITSINSILRFLHGLEHAREPKWERMSQPAKPEGQPIPTPKLVPEIRAIRKRIEELLNTVAEDGTRVGDSQHGVYAFFDYYGEPIYVGQTKEKLRTRVRRHLTNQRTDAVAMRVLDPLEVAEVELWPLKLEGKSGREVDEFLARAEYTVYDRVLRASELKAVLNEKKISEREPITLPKGYRYRIVPEELFAKQKHPDIRIARRSAWIADLARIITERDVSPGLRRTLFLQAKRLLWLAERRLQELGNVPEEVPGEETGETSPLR